MKLMRRTINKPSTWGHIGAPFLYDMSIPSEQTMFESIDDRLIGIIDRLTESVNVCYEAEGWDPKGLYTKSYPYATGYAQSAMAEAIKELDSIVRELRSDD